MNVDVIPARSAGGTVAVEHPGLEVTWGRAVRVWWSLMWRALLFGGIGGGGVGFVIGFFMGAAGASLASITAVTAWAGLLVGIPVGMWVVRHVLRKTWSDFRIVLLPKVGV